MALETYWKDLEFKDIPRSIKNSRVYESGDWWVYKAMITNDGDHISIEFDTVDSHVGEIHLWCDVAGMGWTLINRVPALMDERSQQDEPR